MDALGQDGTTGGAGGPTETVDTAAEFLDAIAQPGPLVVEVAGTIALPGDMHDVTSDKTIVGLGDNAGLTGGGLNVGLPIDDDISEPPANAVHNVIIRNLTFDAWPDDAINVQMFSHHVWIDHNTFVDGSDGAADIKRGSSFVTVSWNHVFHDKNMLLGHDDDNGAQDIGRLNVSYHHNWFDGSGSRNPRVRFGDPVHVYNNYYLNNSDYGIASTMDAGVLVEGNFFEGVDDPYHLGEGSSGPGSIVARDNCFVDSGAGQDGGSVAPIPYGYTLQPCEEIPATVSAGAGAGNLGEEPPTSPPPTTSSPPTSPPPPPPPGELIGWATVEGGTTGGAGGQTVTVTDGDTLANLLEEDTPLIIQVQGMLTMPDGMNDVHSDKTIVGQGTSSGIVGAGLNISSGFHNIIIRNLNFDDWPDDAINVQNEAHHIWVDHNDFTSGGDGSVDIKRGSDFITVSWNHTTHEKNMLLGHDDDNGDQDIGHLRVTYHHNWFDGSDERNPRVRFGNPVHVFNNYYTDNLGYGVAANSDSGVLVEGNFFENVPVPTVIGVFDGPPGDLVERNNVFVNSGTPESTGGGVNPIPYGYELHDPNDVPSIVTAGAGPQPSLG